MILSAHQPNYLPWIGYFHKMKTSDMFVVFDNVQYMKGSFTNRTQLFIRDLQYYLTVSVNSHLGQKINEVTIDKHFQLKKHLDTIFFLYGKSPNFFLFWDEFKKIYSKSYSRLYDLNYELILLIRSILNIKTEMLLLSDIGVAGRKSELLINICKKNGADTYLSGNGAKAYMQDDLFFKNNISVAYQSFIHPEYPQKSDRFIKGLSIIDFIFNCEDYMSIFNSL